jgi:hypothetical protein
MCVEMPHALSTTTKCIRHLLRYALYITYIRCGEIHFEPLFCRHQVWCSVNSYFVAPKQEIVCRRVTAELATQQRHFVAWWLLYVARGLTLQDRQCAYKSHIEARSRNHFCRGKAVTITYFECASVALVIQNAKRMRHIILSSVACLSLPYFFTLSHKRHDFRKKLLNIKRVFWFSLQLFFWKISHSKMNSARYRKCR